MFYIYVIGNIYLWRIYIYNVCMLYIIWKTVTMSCDTTRGYMTDSHKSRRDKTHS